MNPVSGHCTKTHAGSGEASKLPEYRRMWFLGGGVTWQRTPPHTSYIKSKDLEGPFNRFNRSFKPSPCLRPNSHGSTYGAMRERVKCSLSLAFLSSQCWVGSTPAKHMFAFPLLFKSVSGFLQMCYKVSDRFHYTQSPKASATGCWFVSFFYQRHIFFLIHGDKLFRNSVAPPCNLKPYNKSYA